MTGSFHPQWLDGGRTSTHKLFRVFDINYLVVCAVNEQHRATNLEKQYIYNQRLMRTDALEKPDSHCFTPSISIPTEHPATRATRAICMKFGPRVSRESPLRIRELRLRNDIPRNPPEQKSEIRDSVRGEWSSDKRSNQPQRRAPLGRISTMEGRMLAAGDRDCETREISEIPTHEKAIRPHMHSFLSFPRTGQSYRIHEKEWTRKLDQLNHGGREVGYLPTEYARCF